MEWELPNKGILYTNRTLTVDEIRWIKWQWLTQLGKLPYNAWPAPWPPPSVGA